MKQSVSLVRISRSARETKKLGARLARSLGVGDVVLLIGNLGAGKTTLVQGLITALGLRESVMSPTFIVAQSFHAKICVHHLDFYRLSGNEVLTVGVEDYLTGAGEIPPGLVLIEWADRALGLWPADRLEVHMRLKQRSQHREIRLIGHGPRMSALVKKLKT